MKKVLLCLDKDQFKPFNYKLNWQESLKMQGYNTGNNVFQFALQKLLTNENVQLTVDTDFLNNTDEFIKKVNIINSNYDCLITCPANIIAEWAKNTALIRWTAAISKIKIPFIFVGLGAQSNIKYSTDFLENIRYESYEFIKSILNTGASIGVRGEFTADCLEKLGFKYGSDFEITGCPSLFMNGENTYINKNINLKKEQLNPAFNGFKIWFDTVFSQNFEKYKESIYVCQDEFIRIIYHPNKCINKDKKYLSNKYLDLLSMENRVKLYCDFLGWVKDIKYRQINFSFGTRIHGNIVPLLAGIPAFVDIIDSRTRELAEYFSIPHRQMPPKITEDPYELYMEADYSEFNKKIKILYKNFENFFVKNNIYIESDNEIQRALIKNLENKISLPCTSIIKSTELIKRIKK